MNCEDVPAPLGYQSDCYVAVATDPLIFGLTLPISVHVRCKQCSFLEILLAGAAKTAGCTAFFPRGAEKSARWHHKASAAQISPQIRGIICRQRRKNCPHSRSRRASGGTPDGEALVFMAIVNDFEGSDAAASEPMWHAVADRVDVDEGAFWGDGGLRQARRSTTSLGTIAATGQPVTLPLPAPLASYGQPASRIIVEDTQSPRYAASGSHSRTTRENARPHHSCRDAECSMFVPRS